MLMPPPGPQNSGPGTEQGRGGVRVLPLRAPATRRCLCGSQALAVGDWLLPLRAHSEQSCRQHRPRYESALGRTADAKQSPGVWKCCGMWAQQGMNVWPTVALHLRQQAQCYVPRHPSAARGTAAELTTCSWSDLEACEGVGRASLLTSCLLPIRTHIDILMVAQIQGCIFFLLKIFPHFILGKVFFCPP